MDVRWSNELQSWAGEAGYLSTSDDSAAVLYSEGGENRFSIRMGGDRRYELTSASRGNSEKLRLKALSADTIERYLFGTLGDAIRDGMGLPFVPAPCEPSRTAADYAVSDMAADGFRYLLRGGTDAIAARVTKLEVSSPW